MAPDGSTLCQQSYWRKEDLLVLWRSCSSRPTAWWRGHSQPRRQGGGKGVSHAVDLPLQTLWTVGDDTKPYACRISKPEEGIKAYIVGQ